MHPRAAYGLKGNTTHIELEDEWWNGSTEPFDRLRYVRVLCDAEQLELSEYPKDKFLNVSQEIQLDDLVPGLSSDKPIVVSGVQRRTGED